MVNTFPSFHLHSAEFMLYWIQKVSYEIFFILFFFSFFSILSFFAKPLIPAGVGSADLSPPQFDAPPEPLN